MSSLAKNLRYAVRTLRRNPFFTAAAVVCLALGIGVNTAVFSIVNGVLIRQLPYRDPGRIVMVWDQFLARGEEQQKLSGAELLDIREQASSFGETAAIIPKLFNLIGEDGPEQYYGARVSASLFPLLGVEAEHGRTFLPEEDHFGNNRYVLVSHRLWQQRFGGDPDLVGRSLDLDGHPYTVVGVMPQGFSFLSKDHDLWIPIAINLENLPPRDARGLIMVARLAPGVTLERARQEMTTIAGRLAQDYPKFYPADSGWGLDLMPLSEYVVGDVRGALLLLMAAVGLVLVIACANVANLLLARATTRDKEVAIRTSLGAGRRGLLGQFLAESAVVALAGGALGLLLAEWGVRAVVAVSPEQIPRLDEVSIDGRVLLFTLGVSLLTGLLFGLVPALQLLRTDLVGTLKEGGKTSESGSARHLARSLLVVSEVALALLVLVAAALLIRSYREIQQVELGFDPHDLVATEIYLPPPKYGGAFRAVPFYSQVLERLAAIPGVRSAAISSGIPMGNFFFTGEIVPENTALPPGESNPTVGWRMVSPAYFRTLGIPLLRGRGFTEGDDQQGAPVVIVDESLAERLWPGENPLGKRLTLSFLDPMKQARTVVGVVRHVKEQGLEETSQDALYVPYRQFPLLFMYLVLRTTNSEPSMIKAVRSAVREVDRDQAVFNTYTMGELLESRVAWRKFYTVLLGVFAGVALLLAIVGVYGVMSYSVAQRTREIGVRMALGAERRDVLRLVVRQGLLLGAFGVVLGMVLSFWVARVGRSLLFGVSATDPGTFLGVSLLLLLLAGLGSYLPARRATRVDPMVAFRYE